MSPRRARPAYDRVVTTPPPSLEHVVRALWALLADLEEADRMGPPEPAAAVSRPTRWAVSSLNFRAHLLLPDGEHPSGVLQARCGELLLTVATRFDEPPDRRCPRCDSIFRADSSDDPPGFGSQRVGPAD